MDTNELRHKWEKSISEVDDKFLRMLDALYETYKEEETDPFDELSEDVKKKIDKGLEDIEKGRVKSHDEVMIAIKHRYNITG